MIYKKDITELWNNTFDKINSPDGFQPIQNIIKKPKKEIYAVLFDSGNIIECSEDHLFQMEDDAWIRTKDLIGDEIIQTKTGVTRVITIKYIGIEDTYDLTVNHPEHRYYSDGVVSHNTGKTSSATALIKEIQCEALFINASMDNGIDILRGRIQTFAGTESFDGNLKIVVLDECLEENEKVILGTLDNKIPTKLNSLEKGIVYDCISYNMNNRLFENDTCEVISDKNDEIYEVELEDGRTIKVTGNHPFILEKNGIITEKSINDGLSEDDNIVLMDNDGL